MKKKEQRLIDANALKEKIKFGAFGMYYNAYEVQEMPTVDAVEVVRCKDCLYRSQYPDESGHYKCGGLLTEDEELLLMVKPDFFCAYGERRNSDQT